LTERYDLRDERGRITAYVLRETPHQASYVRPGARAPRTRPPTSDPEHGHLSLTPRSQWPPASPSGSSCWRRPWRTCGSPRRPAERRRSPPTRAGWRTYVRCSSSTHSSLRRTAAMSSARASTQATRVRAKIQAAPGCFFGATPAVRPGLLRRISLGAHLRHQTKSSTMTTIAPAARTRMTSTSGLTTATSSAQRRWPGPTPPRRSSERRPPRRRPRRAR